MRPRTGEPWRVRRTRLRTANKLRPVEHEDAGSVAHLFAFGDERGWVSSWRGLALRWLARAQP